MDPTRDSEMDPIRVVFGRGTGPTEVAAYDAALAAANLHNYNLSPLSSVVPPGATVRHVGTAPPELGRIGDRVYAVEASAVGEDRAVAALAWGRTETTAGNDDDNGTENGSENGTGNDPQGDRNHPEPTGPGLFYEASATGDLRGDEGEPDDTGDLVETVRKTASTGLDAGAALRGWEFEDRRVVQESGVARGSERVAAVVLAVYGSGDPILS